MRGIEGQRARARPLVQLIGARAHWALASSAWERYSAIITGMSAPKLVNMFAVPFAFGARTLGTSALNEALKRVLFSMERSGSAANIRGLLPSATNPYSKATSICFARATRPFKN